METGDVLVGPARDCPMHGTGMDKCCPRARELRQLRKSETLGGIPWASRVEVRHELQQLHSRCLETRASMVMETLPLAGTIEDLDSMIGSLVYCKRLLGWKP